MHDLDRTQNGSSANPFASPRPRTGTVLNEAEQMDFATDLMELESEEDFENFLGDLISQGAAAAGKFISSPTGQALGGVLKDAAKQLLPVAGQAVGTYFGGPAGGQIGGALGSAASDALEAETEAQEWEAANTFVKLAADAVNNAAAAPAGANPEAVAQNAVVEAAKVHAPHLIAALSNGRPDRFEAPHRSRRSGRWMRHGRRIILFGV
jgi:hypothetical protein